MTVRNGTVTLPPPATAAGRAGSSQPGYDLIHICEVHYDADGVCPCGDCRAYCGYLPPPDAMRTGNTNDPSTSRDCVVCLDLWSHA